MGETKGVLIIGCGDMGKKHISAWSKRSDCEVVGVYDPDQARAESLAEQYGCRCYMSVDEALSTDGVEIVSVCTPVCFHPEYSIKAMKAGKHVLCEKPIALSLEEASRMQQSALEAGVEMAISYQYRAWPKFAKIRELLQSGQISQPIFLRFTDVREVRPKTAMHQRSMNGGPLIDMAGHFFDLMYHLTGAEPVSVFACGHVFGKGKERLAGIEDLAIDAAEIIVKYEGGHTLSAHVHWALPEGSKAHTNAELITADEILDLNDQGQITCSSGGTDERISLGTMPEGPEVIIESLVNAVNGDRSGLVSAEDGRRALAVSLAVLESISTGELVQVIQ